MRRRVRRRSACSAATASALLLPNCPQFFIAAVRRVEARRHRRAAQSRSTPSTSSRARSATRRRDHRHADALLRPRQARAAADAAAPRHRHQHQGLLSRRCCGCCSRCLREKRDGDRDCARAPAITTSPHLLLAAPRPAACARAPLTPDDPAVLLMSGGTTGTPKGVLGTARRVRDDRPAGASPGRSPCCAPDDDVILLPLPLFHVYAQRRRAGAGVHQPEPARARAQSRAIWTTCSRRSGGSSRRSSTACRRCTSRC